MPVVSKFCLGISGVPHPRLRGVINHKMASPESVVGRAPIQYGVDQCTRRASFFALTPLEIVAQGNPRWRDRALREPKLNEKRGNDNDIK